MFCILQKKLKKRTVQLLIMTKQPNIAIFASGAGTNAEKIIQFYKAKTEYAANVNLVVCNNPHAGVINIAAAAKIEVLHINRDQFFNGDHYLPALLAKQVDWIILAGFLWKVPQALVDTYRNRIINIHPALLPKFGGKGMYGHHVHEAVIKAGEKESGITIHYVDEHYDHGDFIAQYRCAVENTDTPTSLADKIRVLEHTHFASVVAKEIASN